MIVYISNAPPMMSFRGAASQAATWESPVPKEQKAQSFLSIQEEIATSGFQPSSQ